MAKATRPASNGGNTPEGNQPPAPPAQPQTPPAVTHKDPEPEEVEDDRDPEFIQVPTDQWQVRVKKEQRKVPITNDPYVIITGFDLFRLTRTTMLEPHNSKHLNEYAKGIPTHDDFGTLYLPAGKYKQGDIITYADVFPGEEQAFTRGEL